MNKAKWKLQEASTLNELKEGENELGVFEAFIESRAVYDFHHNQVKNGYPKGTLEYNVYDNKITELNLMNGHPSE